jgi:glycerophosphoryl diester phosphodiesterase
VHLVDSTRLRRIREGPERRAADLADAGIEAINLHHSDWTGGLTTLFHRFERCTFGWDAQHERVLAALLAMGIDGVYSDHVDRMVAALELSAR